MKDRLIELIDSFCKEKLDTPLYKRVLEKFSDYLLENSIFIPPVETQAKVYKIVLGKIYEYEVISYTIDTDGFSFIHLAYYMEGETYGVTHSIEDFNRDFYTTREQAEIKLKEGGER